MMRFFFYKLSPPVRLALVYLLFSSAWILLSDMIVLQFHYSPEITNALQNIKGLLFVLLSGLLLFYTSRRIYRQLHSSLKDKEAALSKLTALSEATGEALIDYHFSTDTAHLNERMCALFNTNQPVVRQFKQQHQDRLHPEDRTRVIRQLQTFLQGQEHTWQTEYRYRDSTNRFRNMISRGFVLRHPVSREPQSMLFALQDVTEIHEANARYFQQQLRHRQELTRGILEAQEQERNRWAEELHDNVCQVLTVAKLYQEQAGLQNNPAPFQQKAQEMVDTAIQDIRQLSSMLKPPEFSLTTLYEAIEVLLQNLQRFNHISFTLQVPTEVESSLKLEHKIMLYRIVQEGLNNVLKYAGARTLQLAATLDGNRVRVLLQDDGQGFDPNKNKTGVGLQNIRSRLSAYGGNLSLQSSPGHGCTLLAEFWI